MRSQELVPYLASSISFTWIVDDFRQEGRAHERHSRSVRQAGVPGERAFLRSNGQWRTVGRIAFTNGESGMLKVRTNATAHRKPGRKISKNDQNTEEILPLVTLLGVFKCISSLLYFEFQYKLDYKRQKQTIA